MTLKSLLSFSEPQDGSEERVVDITIGTWLMYIVIEATILTGL